MLHRAAAHNMTSMQVHECHIGSSGSVLAATMPQLPDVELLAWGWTNTWSSLFYTALHGASIKSPHVNKSQGSFHTSVISSVTFAKKKTDEHGFRLHQFSHISFSLPCSTVQFTSVYIHFLLFFWQKPKCILSKNWHKLNECRWCIYIYSDLSKQ